MRTQNCIDTLLYCYILNCVMMMMIERYYETAEGCYTHKPLNYDIVMLCTMILICDL